ncbi:hypothetical protein HK101_004719 [Irineochytrium annulatum]|nr:hypothetical protein HK101_004719 [Irineochytrium annulatum]
MFIFTGALAYLKLLYSTYLYIPTAIVISHQWKQVIERLNLPQAILDDFKGLLQQGAEPTTVVSAAIGVAAEKLKMEKDNAIMMREKEFEIEKVKLEKENAVMVEKVKLENAVMVEKIKRTERETQVYRQAAREAKWALVRTAEVLTSRQIQEGLEFKLEINRQNRFNDWKMKLLDPKYAELAYSLAKCYKLVQPPGTKLENWTLSKSTAQKIANSLNTVFQADSQDIHNRGCLDENMDPDDLEPNDTELEDKTNGSG